MVVDSKDYFHILNKDETMILFHNLWEVYQQVLSLDLHNKKLRKKISVVKKHQTATGAV